MGLAGIALAGLSAGCGDEESISRTEYPIVPVAKPEICESETELKVEGRFVSPAIYCKDKEKRQVACRLKMTSEPPACYVLEK